MILFFIYIIFINLTAFFITVYDKYAAKRSKQRIPEKRFVIFTCLGGGIGILLAFYSVRHKTKHYKLLFIIWSLTIIVTALILFIIISYFKLFIIISLF
jgi:uncharacterized membrane protein YsdA (DUF1294 family)